MFQFLISSFVGPFLYGLVGGAVCCLAFFFVIFRKIERATEKIVRKKAVKHAEFDAVAKAAAVVPNSKVETLCTLVRFDDDIVSEAIQCRAILHSSTIFFYAVDELATLPDHTQEVRAEHLLGKINVSCVDVEARRISKYHRHVNAQQRHAPVKGKCTILTARKDMPLFVVDPTVVLKERLEAAKEERKLLLKQLQKQVHATTRGDATATPLGPVNVETLQQLMEDDKSPKSRHLPRDASPAASQRADRSGAPPAAEEETRADGQHNLVGGSETGAVSASAEVGTAATLTRAMEWARSAMFGNRLPTGSDPAATRQPKKTNGGGGGGGGNGMQALLLSWVSYLAGFGGGGGTSRSSQRKGGKRSKSKAPSSAMDDDENSAGARLAAMEKTLYRWTVIAIKFPTRRENERWLNLLQSTEQTAQWHDFIVHLPKHDVLNLILARLFFESTRTSGLHDLLVKKISKNLTKTAKGLPQKVEGEIYLDNLVVGGEVPLISNVSDPLHHPNGEIDVDFDLLYRGGLSMSIRFAINYRNIRVPDIIFHIKVLELAGRMRFNVGPPPTRKFWLGCPRPPSLRLEFTQEVASHEGFLNAVVSLLPDMSKVMTNVVKVLLFEDMVLPSLDDFPWPVFDAKPSSTGGKEEEEKEEKEEEKDGGSNRKDGHDEILFEETEEVSVAGEGTARPGGSPAAEEKAVGAKGGKKEAKALAEKAKQDAKEAKKRKKAKEKAKKRGETVSSSSSSSSESRGNGNKKSGKSHNSPTTAPTPTPKNECATLLPTPPTLDDTSVHPSSAALPPPPSATTSEGKHSVATQLQHGGSTDGLGEESPEPANPWNGAPASMSAAAGAGKITIRATDVQSEAVVTTTPDTKERGGAKVRSGLPTPPATTTAAATPLAAEKGRVNGEQNGNETTITSPAPAGAAPRQGNRFTTTATTNNKKTTNGGSGVGDGAAAAKATTTTPTALTAEALRRAVDGAAGDSKASGSSGRLPARRQSTSLDALTVSTTASTRARRQREEESELQEAFRDAPMEYYSAGAGQVRRGSQGIFLSSGARAVAIAGGSASRRTSAHIPQQTSATRGGGGARTEDSGNGRSSGTNKAGDEPSFPPTELATVSDRASIANTTRSSKLPPHLA